MPTCRIIIEKAGRGRIGWAQAASALVRITARGRGGYTSGTGKKGAAGLADRRLGQSAARPTAEEANRGGDGREGVAR